MKHLFLSILILLSYQAHSFEDLSGLCDLVKSGQATDEQIEAGQDALDRIVDASGEQYEIQIEEYCEL